MSHWDVLRKRARQEREKIQRKIGQEFSAEVLLKTVYEVTGIEFIPVGEGDVLLDGGHAKFSKGDKIIWYNEDSGREKSNFYISHEYAHFWLHQSGTTCSEEDLDSQDDEGNLGFGVEKVEGYSPQERKEKEANIFAREFLLPSDLLIHWFTVEKLDPASIARTVGVELDMVLLQLSRVVLVMEETENEDENSLTVLELDEIQQEAASHKEGAVLVMAGPGTGKTKTLVARVEHLLKHGKTTESIVGLTFSNKAAEEMRQRIYRKIPSATNRLWIGTFHSFGLELLRKYGHYLGLPIKLKVFDEVSGLLFLEKLLPQLPLEHYLDLAEPTSNLANIQTAISRAKDEMVSPENYTYYAEKMLKEATSLEEEEVARKALEVAEVYAIYQKHLAKENLLDFGDLIFKTVQLLSIAPQVKEEIQQIYPYILVDEFQDVNFASRQLLNEIAGEGKGLWVVGDLRQSIYRFRGASPDNIHGFLADFPDAKIINLKRNYRSRPDIVKVFSAFSRKMQTASGLNYESWEATRPHEKESIRIAVAEDLGAEIRGIAQQIRKLKDSGVAFREQAVLARSHTILFRIAALLEEENIPVLYLGDLFERPEIRDLLTLLSLVGEGNGAALVRVATFPEYRIPGKDVLQMLSWAKRKNIPFPKALGHAHEVEALSKEALEGFALLWRHLENVDYRESAWNFLMHYLFCQSDFLGNELFYNNASGQQKKFSVFQLLQFAYSCQKTAAEEAGNPKKTFLNLVRKLETRGDEKKLNNLLGSAGGIEAVRLMTVHGSKGLEFTAVYLPYLGKGYFPGKFRGEPVCPLPPGLKVSSSKDWHNEEEECLFFVALSRAKDFLYLSRANRYGKSNSNCSNALLAIKDVLPYPPDGKITLAAERSVTSRNSSFVIPKEGKEFSTYQLEIYWECPRKFYYQEQLELSAWNDESGYRKFHNCIYEVSNWIKEQLVSRKQVDEVTVLEQLNIIWLKRGPVGHPYEGIYLEKAQLIMLKALNHFEGLTGEIKSIEHEIAIDEAKVKVLLDPLELQEEGATKSVKLHRIKTGRVSKSEYQKPIYTLYHNAISELYPGYKPDIALAYLSTSDNISITEKIQLADGLKKTRDAIQGISNGEFWPDPVDSRRCPNCAFYFICPAG